MRAKMLFIICREFFHPKGVSGIPDSPSSPRCPWHKLCLRALAMCAHWLYALQLAIPGLCPGRMIFNALVFLSGSLSPVRYRPPRRGCPRRLRTSPRPPCGSSSSLTFSSGALFFEQLQGMPSQAMCALPSWRPFFRGRRFFGPF